MTHDELVRAARKAGKDKWRARLRADPELYEAHLERERERYRERMADPQYREKVNARARERYRERMADPQYREKVNARARERYREQTADPEGRAKLLEKYARLRADPAAYEARIKKQTERRRLMSALVFESDYVAAGLGHLLEGAVEA